ncbi:hypothetical protein FACHB389_36485 [Nostoc calcicola FACHB-389]|nr:hypothetical protein [Nostoc calcicola FACHB-3891]OKH12168.1 hypothetical protein FACHB389_36485 [Nostoc calcicola FACHB-389]
MIVYFLSWKSFIGSKQLFFFPDLTISRLEDGKLQEQHSGDFDVFFHPYTSTERCNHFRIPELMQVADSSVPTFS